MGAHVCISRVTMAPLPAFGWCFVHKLPQEMPLGSGCMHASSRPRVAFLKAKIQENYACCPQQCDLSTDVWPLHCFCAPTHVSGH